MRKARTPFVRPETPALPVATLTRDVRDRRDERDGPNGEAWWIPNCARPPNPVLPSRVGWLLPVRASFAPGPPLADVFTRPTLRLPRNRFPGRPVARARAFQFAIPLSEGGRGCPLRASSDPVSPCAFCEQEGHLATPPHLLRPRVARAQEINRPHPTLCSGSTGSTWVSVHSMTSTSSCRSIQAFLSSPALQFLQSTP